MNEVPEGAITGWTAVPNWILRSGKFKPGAVMVLLVLMSRTNETGECWPSVKTIAAETGQSESSVKRFLRELREAGLVTWRERKAENGDTTSNAYRLHVASPLPKAENGSSKPVEPTPVHTDPPLGHTEPPPGQPEPTPRSHRTHPPFTVTHEEDSLEEDQVKKTPPPPSGGDATLSAAGMTLDEQVVFMRDIKSRGIRNPQSYIAYHKRSGTLQQDISSWRLEQDAMRLTPSQIRKRRGLPERDPAREWMYNQ